MAADVATLAATVAAMSTTLDTLSTALSCASSGRRMEAAAEEEAAASHARSLSASATPSARGVLSERAHLSGYLEQNPSLAAMMDVDQLLGHLKLLPHLKSIDQYFGQPARA